MMAISLAHRIAAFVIPLALLTAPIGAAEPAGALPRSNDVESLLKQRLELLSEIAELQRAAYRAGEGGVRAVLDAEADVAAAKIELAKTPADRVAAHEGLVKVARQIEEITELVFRAQQRPRTDHLKAKAFRLQAEAGLLRARMEKQ
jgi:outer membrane protein TolC